MSNQLRPPGQFIAVVTFVAAAGVGVAVCAAVASGPPILAARWSLFWQLGVWAGAWVVCVIAAFRLRSGLAVSLVLAAALALRLAALAGPPTTSDDLYRYSWDGRVQSGGIDPYARPPAAAQLAGLRERWLWPDSRGCVALQRPAGCTRINRSPERTIYPPAAEAWFLAVYRLGGISAHHKSWQVAGLLVDLASVGILALALRRWDRDVRWLALYALCPAPVLEFVNNGHVDVVAAALVIGALAISIPPNGEPRAATAGRDVAIGLLVGMAALVKLYPAVLLVAVLGLPRQRPWLSFARATGAAAALAVAAYAPHILAVGPRVVGYLPGYLREEHYDRGGRFLIAGLLGLPGTASALLAVTTLASAVAWVAWRRPEAPRSATLLLAALFFTITPVQPWYPVVALLVASLASLSWPAAAVLAAYPYFFSVILSSHHTVGVGRLSYGAALLISVVAGRRCRRPTDREAADAMNVAEAILSGDARTVG